MNSSTSSSDGPFGDRPFRRFLWVFAGSFLLANVAVWLAVRTGCTRDLGLLKVQQFEQGDWDVVVLGNSRPFHAFAPDAFDEEAARRGLALRAYNFAVPGATPADMRAIVRACLSRKMPRVVLLQSDAAHFGSEGPKRIRSHQFFRSCWGPRDFIGALRSGVISRETLVEGMLQLALPLVRYRLEARQMADGLHGDYFEEIEKNRRLIGKAGYSPQDEDPGPGGRRLREKRVEPVPAVDPEIMRQIRETAAELAAAGAVVAIVEYPTLMFQPSRDYHDSLEHSFPEGVVILDYLGDPAFQDHQLYRDMGHLGHEGAVRFSRRIFDDLARRRIGPFADLTTPQTPIRPTAAILESNPMPLVDRRHHRSGK